MCLVKCAPSTNSYVIIRGAFKVPSRDMMGLVLETKWDQKQVKHLKR